MNTLTYIRKMAYTLVATIMVSTTVAKAQEDLAPDQNPNYRKSMEKYIANKDELLKNQGKTIQDTYKAIDDMQIRQDRKDQKKVYRQERRLARINNRRYYNRGSYYSTPYYGNGYNNGYNSYGYNGYNNGYNNYGYNNYAPSYGYSSPGLGYGLNTVATAALLGLGLYWWLK